MTQSDNPDKGPDVSLGLAFDTVVMSQGAASTLLQWLSQQIGHDTEAGAALRDGGIALGMQQPVRESKSKASSSS